MKKYIIIASVVVLLLGLTVVLLCRDTDKDIVYSPAPISLKLRNRLDADFADFFFDKYIPDWYSEENVNGCCKIYGEDNGHTIFNYGGRMTFGGKALVIGDQAFGGDSVDLYAYKNGEFIKLADAYAQGLVSREAIVTARDYHNQLLIDDSREHMITECCPGAVYRFAMLDIEEEWRNMGNETFGTWYTTGDANADWRLYDAGKSISDCGVVMYFGGEQSQTFTTVTIGGSTFSHPTGFRIYYYNGETLVDLATVEDLELYLEELRLAEEQHIQCNNLVFGEGWDS